MSALDERLKWTWKQPLDQPYNEESVTKVGVLIVGRARDRQFRSVFCGNGSDVRKTTKPSCPARGAEGDQADRRPCGSF